MFLLHTYRYFNRFYFLKQFGFTAKLSRRYTGFPDMQYSFIGLASLLSKYMFFKRLSLQKSRSCLDESHFALHNARELKLMVTWSVSHLHSQKWLRSHCWERHIQNTVRKTVNSYLLSNFEPKIATFFLLAKVLLAVWISVCTYRDQEPCLLHRLWGGRIGIITGRWCKVTLSSMKLSALPTQKSFAFPHSPTQHQQQGIRND